MDSYSPDELLKQSEKEEAERRSAPRAVVVYEAIRGEGDWELSRPNEELAWSATAAGMSMGFSFIAEAILAARLPEAEWTPLVSKFGYSIGFLIVILGRQQLFTENTLTPVLPLLREKTASIFGNLIRLWSVVLLFNIVGAVAMALLLSQVNLFDAAVDAELVKIAQSTVHSPFFETVGRALLAGWLIALLVWLLPFAETARVLVIIIITWVIGIGEFYHIIAGTVEATYGVFTGSIRVGEALSVFFIPTLIGNVLGGVSLVAVINHAQVQRTGGD